MNAPPERTRWGRVALLLGAGIVGAFHLGKVPVALPQIARELDLSLAMAGWVVSMVSLTAALGGLLLGLLAEGIGPRRAAIAGLAVATVASLGGALAPAAPWLLASRALEGVGYIVLSVSIPSLIVAEAAPRDRTLALGIWGSYVPAGMATMLALSSFGVSGLGWRGLWVLAAAATGLWMVLLAAQGVRNAEGRAPHLPAQPPRPGRVREIAALAAKAPPLLLAVTFSSYAAQYLVVAAFLPTLLTRSAGMDVATAGVAAAAVVSANVAGNVLSGWMVARAGSFERVVQGASIAMGLLALGVFADALSIPARIACAAAFNLAGGLIPGSMMGAAPRFAPQPALAGGMVGLLLQGAGIGQLIGPPLLGGLVEATGRWSVGGWLCLLWAAVAVVCTRAAARTG